MKNEKLANVGVMALALILCGYAISLMSPIMDDLDHVYRPSALALLNGRDIFGNGFFNAPYLAAWFVPFIGPWGNWLWATVTLCLFIFALRLFGQYPLWLVGLALFSWPAFVSYVVGQIDVIILLGVALGYIAVRRKHRLLLAAAFTILAVKPMNVALVAVLYWLSLPSVLPLVLPAIVLGFGTIAAGLDWLARYVRAFAAMPPDTDSETTIWRLLPLQVAAPLTMATTIVGLAFRRQGFLELTLLAITINLILSPYVLTAHYDVLFSPALLYVGTRNRWLAIGCWIISARNFFIRTALPVPVMMDSSPITSHQTQQTPRSI
ncbi:MAG: hypothetical protein M1570_11610 [Chloroflexi bacterium]|nr:hypothetical protein [Chloroflexota bacterium]